MTLDYDSHPSELVEGGVYLPVHHVHLDTTDGKQLVQGREKVVSVKDLRKAIPPHCFKVNHTTALSFLIRDLFLVYILGWVAWTYIPLIRYEGLLGIDLVRYAAWLLYGYVQGLIFTGIWVCSAGMPVYKSQLKESRFSVTKLATATSPHFQSSMTLSVSFVTLRY
jgi:hypothetical protein